MLEMTEDRTAKERRTSLLLPTAGVALATPFLAWLVIGEVSTGPAHELGPYHVGPESGFVVGGVAAMIAAAAISVLVIRMRQGVVDWRSWGVVAALAAAGAVGAYGWRVFTGGYSGAPLGVGFVWLLGPPLIAGLLVVAVWLARSTGRQRLRRTWVLTLAAVLVAPTLYVFLGALIGR
jgi:hypothetical protein